MEKLGDIIFDILCWVFETKLGHFLFVVLFTALAGLGLRLFLPNIPFYSIMIGASIVAVYAAVKDDNERWV